MRESTASADATSAWSNMPVIAVEDDSQELYKDCQCKVCEPLIKGIEQSVPIQHLRASSGCPHCRLWTIICDSLAQPENVESLSTWTGTNGVFALNILQAVEENLFAFLAVNGGMVDAELKPVPYGGLSGSS
jgi:hypothetical protein